MNLVIKSLSPQLIDDYLFFFDTITFSENPDWSTCYCYSYHFTGTGVQWKKESNRSAVVNLIKDGKMKGYLAFDGDKPIGWCNANDRKNYQALKEQTDTGSRICSVVCFLISPGYRRRGIAGKLLEQVCAGGTRDGFDVIEAYPRKDSLSCEGNYHGHFSLYEKFDFKVEAEFDDHFVVRKRLK